jgi:hypothetical protein
MKKPTLVTSTFYLYIECLIYINPGSIYILFFLELNYFIFRLLGFDVRHLESSPACSNRVIGRPELVSAVIAASALSVSEALLFDRQLRSSSVRFAGGDQPSLPSASEVSTGLPDLVLFGSLASLPCQNCLRLRLSLGVVQYS